jgi:hypothetical protein
VLLFALFCTVFLFGVGLSNRRRTGGSTLGAARAQAAANRAAAGAGAGAAAQEMLDSAEDNPDAAAAALLLGIAVPVVPDNPLPPVLLPPVLDSDDEVPEVESEEESEGDSDLDEELADEVGLTLKEVGALKGFLATLVGNSNRSAGAGEDEEVAKTATISRVSHVDMENLRALNRWCGDESATGGAFVAKRVVHNLAAGAGMAGNLSKLVSSWKEQKRRVTQLDLENSVLRAQLKEAGVPVYGPVAGACPTYAPLLILHHTPFFFFLLLPLCRCQERRARACTHPTHIAHKTRRGRVPPLLNLRKGRVARGHERGCDEVHLGLPLVRLSC